MTPMKHWLLFLLAFFRPQVDGDAAGDGGEQAGEEKVEGADKGAEAGDEEQLDLELDDAGGEEKVEDKGKKENEDTERRIRAAEDRAAKAERDAAEARIKATPRQQDAAEEQENAKLNDPATPALEKWQIQANRTLRQNTNAAQFALAQAQDVRDQTAFAAVCMADPVAKKYQTRVEEELTKARSSGQNPSREAIFTYMLGKDMREGKFKRKAAPAVGEKKSVDRGKLPGAKSDVQGKGTGLSKRDQLARKLDGVQI